MIDFLDNCYSDASDAVPDPPEDFNDPYISEIMLLNTKKIQ